MICIHDRDRGGPIFPFAGGAGQFFLDHTSAQTHNKRHWLSDNVPGAAQKGAHPLAANDDTDPVEMSPAPGVLASLVMALRFYSRLPLGGSPHQPLELNRIAPVLPLAGSLIGLPAALVMVIVFLLGGHFLFAATMGLATAVITTGAMAEDGLADAMDGLFGGATPARRLQIMHDARHGTYGVLALVFSVLIRVTILAALMALDPMFAAMAWLGTTVVARSFSLWLPATLASARPDGVAASAGSLALPRFTMGAAGSVLVFVLLALPLGDIWAVGTTLAFMAVGTLLWRALCEALAGGTTGDLIGAGQQLLEIAGLSFFMLWVI
jgi:adenosylcobinamide-GDP ribazoletransferase